METRVLAHALVHSINIKIQFVFEQATRKVNIFRSSRIHHTSSLLINNLDLILFQYFPIRKNMNFRFITNIPVLLIHLL